MASLDDAGSSKPRWLRMDAAIRYSGLNRHCLYRLIREQKVRSFALRAHPEAKGGMRYVSAESLDRYLDACAAASEQEVPA